MTLIPALIVGVLGLLLTVWLLSALLRPLGQWIPALSALRPERLSLFRKERLLGRFEEDLGAGDPARYTATLKGAFFLDAVRTRPLVEETNQHNNKVIQKLEFLSGKLGTGLPEVQIIQELLVVRRELLIAYIEENARLKRKTAEREVPKWGVQEFQRKLGDIQSRIDTNRKTIDEQVTRLAENLVKTPPSSEITYH